MDAMDAPSWCAIVLCGAPDDRSVGVDLHYARGLPPGRPTGIHVPPGAHFVRVIGPADVSGVFLDVAEGQAKALVWDKECETFHEAKEDDDEANRYVQAAKSGKLPLAPCDQTRCDTWTRLVSRVDQALLDRIAPVGGTICASLEPDPFQNHKSKAELQLDQQLERNPRKEENEDACSSGGGRCFYTPVERLVKRKNKDADASELTESNLNRWGQLLRIMEKHHQGNPLCLLGEFQFSFVAFLLGQSILSFFHWRDIVTLVLNCDPITMDEKHRLFLEEFLRALHWQLHLALEEGSGADTNGLFEGGFMEELLEGSFIRSAVAAFVEMVADAPPELSRVADAAGKIKQLLKSALGWDFSITSLDNDDEFAPTVVRL